MPHELIRWHVSASQWSIQLPLEGETFDKNSEYRIIVPVHTSNFAAVSQDVVKSPDEVFLVKNLQVWSFEAVREADKLYEWVFLIVFAIIISDLITIRIRSNLYAGLIGSIPLLGADKEFKKVNILLDIMIKLWMTKTFFHLGRNPTYPCCSASTSEASLEIAWTDQQELKSRSKF